MTPPPLHPCLFEGKTQFQLSPQRGALTGQHLDLMRQAARLLCQHRGLAVLPYGQAWWIVGRGVSRVVADLAGIDPAQLRPLPVVGRKSRLCNPEVD